LKCPFFISKVSDALNHRIAVFLREIHYYTAEREITHSLLTVFKASVKLLCWV